MNDSIYREQILELYKHPANKGSLENPTHKHREHNPLCGDDITITIITKDNKIEQIKWDGVGCAISSASASLLTDAVKGKTIDEVMHLTKEDILELIEIDLSPVRLKCALLSLEVLQKALNQTEAEK